MPKTETDAARPVPKGMVLYAVVFLAVAYGLETAFLNFAPWIPRSWQNPIALAVAFLVAYPLIRRRRHA
jgi:hypothetical protein